MQPPIEEFVKEEEAKKLADSTLRRRKLVMGWLDEWSEKPIEEFDRGDIRDFLVFLRDDRGASDGTVADYMGHVTELFEFLTTEGYIARNENPREDITYSDYLDYGKTTERQKALRDGTNKEYVALDTEEVEKLLANAGPPKLRNLLMMKLQVETGPRAGELVRLRIDDVHESAQTVTYRTLKKDVHMVRTLPYGEGVASLLEQWLHGGYRDRFSVAANSEYIFVSRQSERVAEASYNRRVKEAAERAGIQKPLREDSNGNTSWKVTSHVLRHTYAEKMVENGCDISLLADLMGHEDIETTRKYLDHKADTLVDAQREFGPEFSSPGH